ncbi:ras-related and estrogen-regulated growth inhibitor-like protein [Myxocyprinus asiaticus]|uniref:ras-related and estrogen-regulated growth inhibitor-like protein n=1 Tax=Myxocyprinus asiaticus TaxID=70543 RepID=UPI002221F663|nr:ras-related and estrogen-regulated growth inhibitor-like protein [Myxocyprinus asiaticus]XP_051526344.1 ras-related and estrogen-regulated growth inhibitor-like protein [Myxocyprinus asiaticus]XP_051526346.1 ras-related and estrogen-regulated growth inhibitor-like protein [Myxocyprinus asiaticus]XP_051526347.1 ras-related and estrogen-regulated growth inhibitor-like protein [Myxocyprinus asiaticus]
MVVQVKTRIRYSSKSMEGNQQKVEANILLLGAENVGKSALTVRFLTRRFIGEYGDIESIYSHTDKIDGRDICFNIWDSLCPQNGEEPGCISERQLQWADGYILVYSICDRASFSVVRQQVQRIRQAKQKPASTAPIIIVGNKRDLQHRRTVSSEEGRLLALSADCGFFEVSAAETYHGVLMVFHELFELIREARALKKGTAGFKGIVRSMSAVFGRKRTE